MSLQRYYDAFAERLQSSASVASIYGEPVVAGGRTILPVGRIAYGFGGGPATEEAEGSAMKAAGGGGGVRAVPLGVFEITAQGTRFVRAASWKREAAWLLAGVALGVTLGRLSASR